MTASARDVVVVRTGSANLASVLIALERCGARPRLTSDPSDILHAPRLVLPGVGTFGAAMHSLHEHGLVEPLRARLAPTTPPAQSADVAPRDTLCICVGMQLLFDSSDESPGAEGLCVVPGRVSRFTGNSRVPQLGWNGVLTDNCSLVRTGAAYYANSYRVTTLPTGWRGAWSSHAGRFLAAMERSTPTGATLACQFHPELSGAWGADLLKRWCEGGNAADSTTLSPVPGVGHTPTSVARRVIPCLDVRDGRIVKGVRFQGLRDAGDPVAAARAYAEQGADELVILDVSATAEGRPACLDTVQAVRRELNIPLTVGGGVRGVDDASALLEAGADKVGVNTAAVRRPELLRELGERFGRQCVVLAIDAARRTDGDAGWIVLVAAGKERTGLDTLAWAARAGSLGAGEILLTSWDRDGTGDGYDLPLLSAVSSAVSVPVIASGGAAEPRDCVAALRAGADAVLAATIFHDGRFSVGDVKRAIRAEHMEVRA